jgi:hypothetical protein
VNAAHFLRVIAERDESAVDAAQRAMRGEGLCSDLRP